tara:strand:+ start:715 stop:954 length:240 start_codon:yes stop_codon:yes gene_type:complete
MIHHHHHPWQVKLSTYLMNLVHLPLILVHHLVLNILLLLEVVVVAHRQISQMPLVVAVLVELDVIHQKHLALKECLHIV